MHMMLSGDLQGHPGGPLIGVVESELSGYLKEV